MRKTINTDLLGKLINRVIINKYQNVFNEYEINLDDNGVKNFIFITLYVNPSQLNKQEDIFLDNLKKIYGDDLDNVPDDEESFLDKLRTDVYKAIYLIIFKGLALDPTKNRLVVEVVE